MNDLLTGEEGSALLQVGKDDRVGLLRLQAGVLARVVSVAALVIHRDHQLHLVALAGLVVIGAEAGGGVDAAGAGIHGDILGAAQQGFLIQEGVLGLHILEVLAAELLNDLIVVKAARLHHLGAQGLGHDVELSIVRLDQHIALPGVNGNRQVAGQGPNGSGPDDEVHVGQVAILAQTAQIVLYPELHIDSGAGVVLVLDLRLGQGGLVVGAPVHGLKPLVDVALAVHGAEDLDLLRLKAGVHSLIGVLPVPQHTHALEALHLDVDVFLGVVVAGGAELCHAHLLAVELLLLDDGGLDGHAVVVPAGDIGGVIAPHGVGPGDKVLDGLVQGVAHVQIAVGEGRAVMEGEAGFALILLQQLVVQVHVVPALEHPGLPVGQTGPHGEVSLGEIDGLVVVHGFASSYSGSFLDFSIKLHRNVTRPHARQSIAWGNSGNGSRVNILVVSSPGGPSSTISVGL